MPISIIFWLNYNSSMKADEKHPFGKEHNYLFVCSLFILNISCASCACSYKASGALMHLKSMSYYKRKPFNKPKMPTYVLCRPTFIFCCLFHFLLFNQLLLRIHTPKQFKDLKWLIFSQCNSNSLFHNNSLCTRMQMCSLAGKIKLEYSFFICFISFNCLNWSGQVY